MQILPLSPPSLLELETELQNLLDDASVDRSHLHRVSDAKAAGRCKLLGSGLLSGGRIIPELIPHRSIPRPY
jgi:hypothetical protein